MFATSSRSSNETRQAFSPGEVGRVAGYWQLVIPRGDGDGADRHTQIELQGYDPEPSGGGRFITRVAERVRRDVDELIRYVRMVHCHSDRNGNIAAEELVVLKCYPDSGPLNTWRHDIATRPIGLHEGHDKDRNIKGSFLRHFSCGIVVLNGDSPKSPWVVSPTTITKLVLNGHGQDARFSMRVKFPENCVVKPDTYAVMFVKYFIAGNRFKSVVSGVGPELEFYMDRPTTLFRFTVTAETDEWSQPDDLLMPMTPYALLELLPNSQTVARLNKGPGLLMEGWQRDESNILDTFRSRISVGLLDALDREWMRHITNRSTGHEIFNKRYDDLEQGFLARCKVNPQRPHG